MAIQYPSIPLPSTDPAALYQSVLALKGVVDTLTGGIGNGDAAAVTPAAVSSAVGGAAYVSYGAAQSLSAAQQAQARANANSQANKVYAENTTWTTGTTTMAGAATTVPQSTDGTQILSASITPTLATSKLLIRVAGGLTASASANIWAALFQGATPAAIAAAYADVAVINGVYQIDLVMQVTAGSTSAITFAVNIGNFNGSAATWAINGSSSAQRLGGSMRWAIAIEEIKG